MLIKYLHITCAALSLLSFIIRGFWMLQDNPLLQARLTKIAPHIIDTLLLISAITLAVQWHLSPLEQPWLAAKIIALLLYIGLGTVALKRGKTKKTKVTAWIAALFVFGYIAMVAVSKSPFLFI